MVEPRLGRALQAGLCLVMLAGAVRAGTAWTLDEDLTLGPDRYRANRIDLGVMPTPATSVDLSYGTNRTTTPVADSTRQFGFGAWGELGPVVSLSVHYFAFTGDRAMVINPAGDVVGEADDRIRTGTLGAKLGFRLLRPGEDDETPVSLRLDLGAAGAREAMPLYVGTVVPATWRRLRQAYEIRDAEYSAGLSARAGGTSLTATYARHHYTDNFAAIEAAFLAQARTGPRLRPLLLNTLSGIRYNAMTTVRGQPRYDSYVGVTQRFLRDWSVTASCDYQDMIEAGEIARQPAVGLAWEAASWIEARLGTYWVNQFHRNARYTTAGVSFYF